MEIIIVGLGKVGYSIARSLSVEKDVNITIIDNKPEALDKAADSLDVMRIDGNGLSANTLIEAGAKKTDLIISVTDADEANILCCILGKSLGIKHTIARVRNPEYSLDLNWKKLGLDMIINPEQQTAREISRNLRFPAVGHIDTFVNGRVELVSFKVSDARDFFVGKSVAQIFNKTEMNVLLAVIERDNTVLIPHGEIVFEERDIIRVLGRASNIMDFFALSGQKMERIKNAVIVGGSKITYYLVNLLQRHSSNTHITIIEKDKEKCEDLSETFPRCLIIHGDGTDEDILTSESVDRSGAIICLTDRDEENTIIALYSLELGLRKIILKINHINRNMVSNLGFGSIVSTMNVTSDRIIHYVRGLNGALGKNIRTIYKIFENDEDSVEAVELTVCDKSDCLGISLKDLKIRKGILIGCIVRGSNIIIPFGKSHIEQGDNVIIFAKNRNILKLDDILE